MSRAAGVCAGGRGEVVGAWGSGGDIGTKGMPQAEGQQ